MSADGRPAQDRKLTVTCRICGVTNSVTFAEGGAVDALRRLDAVHDLLTPECPEASKRTADATPHPDPPASALTSPAAGVESVVLAGGAPRQDGADNGGAA